MHAEILLTPRTKAALNILIIDGDLRFCEVLSLILRLEGYGTTLALDWPSESVGTRGPDAIFLEISGEYWRDRMARIRATFPGTPIICIMPDPAFELAVDSMKMGAFDALPRQADQERILSAARAALHQKVRLEYQNGNGRAVKLSGFSQLTAREQQVLELVANGATNKATARSLGISPRTVEVHRASIMRKLGAANAADLVRVVLTA